MSYPTFSQKSDFPTKELMEHLKSWGLRRFSDETTYYQWQKDVLGEQEIAELNRLANARSGGDQPEADMRFYDLAAGPKTLPILYSQRFEYFLEVGCAITDRIDSAQRVLDFGCGVGILTSFYAWCFPHITFMGIDRSPASIVRAREEAAKRGLSNLQFECFHIPIDDLPDSFDLIISSHSLFQAEGDPGLPSLSWKTFERADDNKLQVQGEIRTGLKDRLDSLSNILSSGGRMLLCEKAWHIGRRILWQRALESRGYHLLGAPVFFRYRAVDEVVQDGPLFEVSREPKTHVWAWNEEVTIEPGESLYRIQGDRVEECVSSMAGAEMMEPIPLGGNQRDSFTVTFNRWRECLAYGLVESQSGFRAIIIGSLEDEKVIHQYFLGADNWTEEKRAHVMARLWPPLKDPGDEAESPTYENHTAVAQKVWDSLPDRDLKDQATFREQDGREMHIEWGTSGPLTYLYWANTYDQRQLVLMTPHRAKVLQNYYQESLAEMKRSSGEKNYIHDKD